jgi:hypothetical protein
MMTANFAVSIPLHRPASAVRGGHAGAAAVALGSARAGDRLRDRDHLCFIIWITLTGLTAMWLMKLRPHEIFYLQPPEADVAPQPEAT